MWSRHHLGVGWVKQRQIEQSEHGYSMMESRAVCAACTGEPDLAALVESRLTYEQCDFCGREANQPIAADTDDVLDHIGESLQLEFEDADAVLPYDRESSTGLFGTVFDTRDAIEHAGSELEGEGFAEFVVGAFVDTRWCERDPFALRPHEELAADWRAFRALTERRIRFLFLLDELPADGDGDPPLRQAGQMLAEISRLVEEIPLAREVPAGTVFVRARVHHRSERPTTATDLGTAPADVAGDSRMTPAGISAFYGAPEPETARAETVDDDRDRGRVVTVAEFETTKDAWVVDLSALPPMPGIFDEQRQRQRTAIAFLQEFRDDISQPVRPDRLTHPEYVPTQIVTEYLRHVVRAPDGSHFNGVIYPSAPQPGSESVVLFVGPENCIDSAQTSNPDVLQLRQAGTPRREDIS